MLSISDHINSHPVKKVFVGYGDEAISNTLILMSEIINKSIGNYYVRRWAEKITENAVSASDKVNAIFYFLASKSNYLKDPAGLEMIKTPVISLQLIEFGERPQLDCDDYTVLSLSLLKSIGFPVALKAIAPNIDKKFKHVYGLVYVDKKWTPVDLTKPSRGIGWQWPNPTRVLEMKV